MHCNNVVMLHNITSWCGTEVTNGSHRAVMCKGTVHVLMYEGQVLKKIQENCIQCNDTSCK